MSRAETTELTVLCLLEQDGNILLQDRVKADWRGFALPGGHIEPGESIVSAVVREMQEETGLTVLDPVLCGVKQFPRVGESYEAGRYLVFLFRATRFSGTLRSSDEGQMHWIRADKLQEVNLVDDLEEMLRVMRAEDLSEFQYIVNGGVWNVVTK